MQWWNDFVDWFYSEDGWKVFSTVVIPFLAIVVAGLVAALIGRASTRRVIGLTERDRRVATVTALISSARRASKWNTLSGPEQQHAEHLANEADTLLRLLPLPGTAMTADWVSHEMAEMKKNSVSFSFQAEQSLIDFRDRLVEWQAKPSRAKKLFKTDLDSWAYDSSVADHDLVQQQQDWAKQQIGVETGSIPTVSAPAASATAATTAVVVGAASATPAAADSVVATPAEPAMTHDWSSLLKAGEAAASVPAKPEPEIVPEAIALPAAASTPAHSTASAPSTDEVTVEADEQDSPEAVAPAEEAKPISTIGQIAAPGPISAGTVRQRITPQKDDY